METCLPAKIGWSRARPIQGSFEDVPRFLHARWREIKKERADLLPKKAQQAREDKLWFTLVKDPSGNSTIISEKAEKRSIDRRELRRKFGEQAIAARNVQ